MRIGSKKKLKTETTFADVKSKTETIFPDVKPKSETILPDIKPNSETILPEIKPAITPFPIDEPLLDFKKHEKWLDNWLNNLLNDKVDGQTEIFVDENYQSWADDNDNKPNIKTNVFLPAADDNVDSPTEIFVDLGLLIFQI